MSDLKVKEKPHQKTIADKKIWMKKLAKDHLEKMSLAIKRLLIELIRDATFKNYFRNFRIGNPR